MFPLAGSASQEGIGRWFDRALRRMIRAPNAGVVSTSEAMATVYLKRAAKSPESESGTARDVAQQMLTDIERRGEDAVREYAARLDRWSGPIVMTAEAIRERVRDVPEHVRRDIEFAAERVRRFALAQRDSVREFAT